MRDLEACARKRLRSLPEQGKTPGGQPVFSAVSNQSKDVPILCKVEMSPAADASGDMTVISKAGKKVKPFFGIGFRSMAQFGEVFIPKRWENVLVDCGAG